jgi:hypothetical protein
MVFQLANFDILFRNIDGSFNIKPFGFMGNPGITSGLIVMCIPLLATRSPKSFWLSLALLFPIYLCRGRINYVAAGIVFSFLLFFKIPKKWWIALMVVVVLIGAVYFFHHPPHDERFNQWKLSLRDYALHPIVGWGLDSYRNISERKPYVYITEPDISQATGEIRWSTWDNPHNLYVSLLYEWGLISILILIGYLRHLGILFKNAIKDPNTLALAGVLLAVLIISAAHFPLFLARCLVLIIPCAALFEVNTK